MKVRAIGPDGLADVALHTPWGMTEPADVVRIPVSNEAVWRVTAPARGDYVLTITAMGQSVTKRLCVGRQLARLSRVRARSPLWRRWFDSVEPAIEPGGPIESVEILYPPREISIIGFSMNWLVWFFAFSLIAGFIFKSALGIEI